METELTEAEVSRNTGDKDGLGEMIPGQLVQKLRVEIGTFPKEVIREIQRRRDETVPALIQLLEEGIEKVRAGKTNAGEGSFFAFLLLVEFEAEVACDALFRAISLDGEQIFDLIGDGVHEFLPFAIPGIAQQRIDEVFALACSHQVDPWARGSLTKGIGLLEIAGKRSREQVIEMLRRALRSAVDERNDVLVTLIAMNCADLRLPELLEDIRESKRLRLLDEGMISLQEVEQYLNVPANSPQYRLQDTIKAVENWGCFAQKTKAATPEKSPTTTFHYQPPTESVGDFAAPQQGTIRLDAPHVGRNEPCSCGSGKKFKKCCARSKGLPEL